MLSLTQHFCPDTLSFQTYKMSNGRKQLHSKLIFYMYKKKLIFLSSSDQSKAVVISMAFLWRNEYLRKTVLPTAADLRFCSLYTTLATLCESVQHSNVCAWEWCGKGCVKRHVSLFCGHASYPLDPCKIAHKHIYNAKLWFVRAVEALNVSLCALCGKRILTLQQVFLEIRWFLNTSRRESLHLLSWLAQDIWK